MLKTILRRLVSRRIRNRIKAFAGIAQVDEADLLHDLLAQSAVPRTMIDVGAHHGSSLEDFARSGWTVHAFEPDAANRSVLTELCRGWSKVTIDPRAVSDQEETGRPFFTSPVSSGISALAPFHATHHEAGRVDTTTLRSYCERTRLDAIGFLKIDTEGHDLFVLRGADWDSVPIHAVLCEFEDRKTLPLGYDFHALAGFLAEKGYRLLVSEWRPVVEYGRRHDWLRFARYPVSLHHPDAWGNIIALRDEALFARLCAIKEVAASLRQQPDGADSAGQARAH